jgi:uncharacterized protein YukJ
VTINVQSSKNVPGSPVAATYLYFLIDNDFRHPILHTVLARPSGLTKTDSTYASGALDYVKGNLFDPRKMRVLPTNSVGGDDLLHRLSAQLSVARDQDHELMIFGSQFRTSQHQTDIVFDFTPPLGIDNIHMAQGDPPSIDSRIRENGSWHDGGIFILNKNSGQVSAIFLSFQTQAWQTDGNGQALNGRTGYEAPTFDFSNGVGDLIQGPSPLLEMTSLHRLASGRSSLVIANMSDGDVDLTGWSVLSGSDKSQALGTAKISPGQPITLNLPESFVDDQGGILTLRESGGLRVDGISYLGGTAGNGWSTSFNA